MHKPFPVLTISALVLVTFWSPTAGIGADEVATQASDGKTLRMLFIGNSYTGRHNLSTLVKAMAEAGDPGLEIEVTTVIYGGRTLADHWRLGSQNYVNIMSLTGETVQETIESLESAIKKDPRDRYATAALRRQRELLESLGERRKRWDFVVLQSYRDDLKGAESRYAQYAPKFAALIQQQGGRVVLYETTPTTQNAQPLNTSPASGPMVEKANMIATLGKKTNAIVVPMSIVAHHCQTVRPDLTLRFVNDAHLNQTLAYLTACTFYAAIFDRSPEGLPIDRVTDIRFLDNTHRDKDRDGGPITRIFSDKDRADLQRIAWEGLQRFHKFGQPH